MTKSNHRDFKKIKQTLLFCFLIVLSILVISPVIIVLINSFKTNTGIGVSLFSIPYGDFFAKFDNYIVGLTFGNYPFLQAILNFIPAHLK